MVIVKAKRNFQTDEGFITVGQELRVTNVRAKQLMNRRLVEVVADQPDLHPDFAQAFADVPEGGVPPASETVNANQGGLLSGSSIFPGGASGRAREFREKQREASEEAQDQLSERAEELREKRRATGADPTEDPDEKASTSSKKSAGKPEKKK